MPVVGGKWADPHAGASSPSFETQVTTKALVGSSASSPTGLMSVMWRLSHLDSLRRPFVQSGVVYACVQVRAKLISEAVPKLWTSDEEDAKELPASDPLLKLLKKPNSMMGRIKFLRTISQQFDLAGGTFLFLTSGDTDRPIRPGELPGAVWPIQENYVQINFGAGNVPDSYEFTVDQEVVEFPAHAVAHIYDLDPDNPVRGIGPMQAAWRSANNLFRAEGFDDALVESGGQVGGMIFPTGDIDLGEEERKQLSESMQQNYLDPRKSGRVAVFPRGIDFKQTQFSPRDMQAKDLRILGRNHIMMIFGVTPPLLGIVEDVNRANGRESRRVFYESHGIPHLELIADEVNAHLMPLIGYEGKAVFGFDTSNIAALREDAESVQKRVRGWMEMGRSFEEACEIERVDFDFKGWEGIEDRYRATGLVPLSLDEAQMDALANADPDEELDEDGNPVKPGKPDDEEGLPGDKPRVGTEAAGYPSGLSHESRRALAVEFDAGLQKFDAAIRRVVAKRFKEFVLGVRKVLREKAASATRLSVNGHRARAWRFFSAETREWITVRGITDAELEALLKFNMDEWGKRLWDDAEPVLVSAMEHSAGWAAARVDVKPFLVAQDPRVLAFLEQKEVLLKETFGPLREQVKRAIITGMAGSPDAGTVEQRIAASLRELEKELKVMTDRIGTRAAMIARTEVTGAANAASSIQYAEAGIKRHEWLSSKDELVRQRHRIDGEPTIIGHNFSNGLRWPGDPAQGDASNVVNCRCTTLPVIEPRT